MASVLAKKFGLYINTELYGLLLWKVMFVHLCGVDIAYRRLSGLVCSGHCTLAHAVDECILCHEGQQCALLKLL